MTIIAKNGEESHVSALSPLKRSTIEQRNRLLFILFCAVYRIIALLLLRTTFVPDEYYQSVEPAFKFVFNNSTKLVIPPLTWEWQSEYRIRSYIPILHYIKWFQLLQLLGIDNAFLIRNGPRVIQTFCSVIGDISLYFVSKIIFVNEDIARDITIVNLLSWSGTYCMSRTLVNSYETILQNVGAWFWIICIKNESKKLWYDLFYVVLVTISVYSRPTSLLWWLIPMSVYIMMDRWRIVYCSLIGLCTCVACIIIDSYHYNAIFNYPDGCLYTYNGSNEAIKFIIGHICTWKVTITPLNFYIYNVHRSYAELFGIKTWYWTLVEGLPVVSGFYAPFIFYEIFAFLSHKFRGVSNDMLLNYLVFSALFYAISLRIVTSHQEYRFLLPCLPALHMLLGIRFNQLKRNSSKWRILYFVSFVLNAILATALLTSHQNGAENSFKYLVNHINIKFRDIQVPAAINVYVVAPCYSFPGYSYIHDRYQANIQIRLHYLSCFPLQTQHAVSANDIYHTLKLEAGGDCVDDCPCNQVNYLVTFDTYKESLSNILDSGNYYKLYSVRHSFFKYDYDDAHENKFVYIYSTDQSCSTVQDIVNL